MSDCNCCDVSVCCDKLPESLDQCECPDCLGFGGETKEDGRQWIPCRTCTPTDSSPQMNRVDALARFNEISRSASKLRIEHLEKIEGAIIEGAKLSLAEGGPVEIPDFFLFGRKVTIELENSP